MIHARQLENELAAMTAERDEALSALEAWRFNEAAWGTSPEAIRRHIASLTKDRDIWKDIAEDVLKRGEEKLKDLKAEREKVAMLREALLAIDTAIDKTMAAQEAEHGCSRSAVRLRQDATVAKDIAYDLKIKALEATK